MSTLSPTEIALGRSRTYALLSRLYRRALDEETIGYVRAIPALADALPTPADADELAASYEALFGFNVFPYQTLFLDPAGQLGGPEQARVRQSLATATYRPDPENAEDTMAEELALLAFLCGAEADAQRDQLDAIAHEWRRGQATFLTQHLLRWIGPFTAAVERNGAPFYRALAELSLAFVADHAAGLGLSTSEWTLPADTLQLDDKATDLRTIVGFLLQTPASGLYFTRADLTRMGRMLDLPRGFGDRQQLLLTLLRTAATYELFPKLVHALADEADDFVLRYAAICTDHPALAGWLQPWQAQAEKTHALLGQIADLSTATAA